MLVKTEEQYVSFEQVSPNVHVVKFKRVVSGWEYWILLSSDRHHDNVHCDQKFEKKQLDQVKERNGLVLDFGDLFCAMQGKYDPRSSMDDLRPEHKTTRYLDALVETAYDFYSPYAKNILVLGKGNHETNITKRHGTDLTGLLASRLRAEGGNTQPGGYGGWVRLQFEIRGESSTSKKIKYFHGAGGAESPVTKGVIHTNRQAVYLPDADLVVNGHNHESYIVPIQRERLNQYSRVDQDTIWFLRTPGYKDEYGDGSSGFHIERGRPPKPIGACWLRLFYDKESIGVEPILALR